MTSLVSLSFRVICLRLIIQTDVMTTVYKYDKGDGLLEVVDNVDFQGVLFMLDISPWGIRRRGRHGYQKRKIIYRLARVEGHIRSIREMVSEDRAYSDVLVQLAAVRSALDKAGKVILVDHLDQCISLAKEKGTKEDAYRDLENALNHFWG